MKKDILARSVSGLQSDLGLRRGELPFPVLDGITEVPIIRPDGSVSHKKGYDAATHTLHVPSGRYTIPIVSESPTKGEIEQARALLDYLLSDFPFETRADKATFVGLLITPVVRKMIAGPVPIAAMTARDSGTGKGLLAQAVAVIATGREAGLLSAPTDDAEWRKQLTGILLGSPRVVLIDNEKDVLESASLEKAITAEIYADRLLGGNRIVEAPVCCTWMITGNNLRGD